jgi:hypothetical protein
VREALSGKSSPDRSLSPATSPTLSPTPSLRGERDYVDGSCSPTASPTAAAEHAPDRLRLALDRHVGTPFDSPSQRADAPTDSLAPSPDKLESHDTLSPMIAPVPRGAAATLRPVRNGGVVQQLSFCKGATASEDSVGAGWAGIDRTSGPLATGALAGGSDAGGGLRAGGADGASANGGAADPGGASAASPPAPPSRFASRPSPLRLPNAFGLEVTLTLTLTQPQPQP